MLFLIFVQMFFSCSSSLQPSPAVCRNEQQIYLPYEQFKLISCARCYRHMPPSHFKYKLKYDVVFGSLLDPLTNTTYLAIPSNSSQMLLGTFLDETAVEKWKACCRAARQCCKKMTQDPKPTVDGLYCPRTWDGWSCWADTPAGTTASQSCPEHIYFESKPPSCSKFVSKQCMLNGTWYLKDNLKEWTNYSKCGRREEHQRYLQFHMAMYIISVIAIIPALIIFVVYKQLHIHRISMHKNLLLSLLLNDVASILFKTSVISHEFKRGTPAHQSVLNSNGFGCKLLLILIKYFRMTNYMWMFCEAYYLHKLIVAAFAEQKNLFFFYAIGWGLPVVSVSIYAVIRATLENEKCWAFPVEKYEWIMNAPNLLSLAANLFFLCNIIRVLVTKLRAAHANEPSQYRKAVRATLVLVPLFGLHFCLVIYRPQSGKCGLLEAYVYFNYAMDGLQGFMVALIFCYLNGEVHYLIKRSYQRYKLHLQIRGSIHNSAIARRFSRRFSTTQDSTMNDSHHHRSKYMESKLKELNDLIRDHAPIQI